MYQIVRIFFKGEVESHSIEERENYRDALTRFHTIIATDLGNAQVTYCYCAILNENGRNEIDPFIYNSVTNEEGEDVDPFKNAVLRVRVKNDQRSTSVEFKEERQEALKRYFSILAADLTDDEVSYNMCSIVEPNGRIVEGRSFTN